MANVNRTLNGIPGTLWEIRRQEHTHFYLGYRQAILIIESLSKNLMLAKLDQKKTNLVLKKETDKLETLEEIDREIHFLEIEIIKQDCIEKNILIRDTLIELEIAIAEKERIEIEHPELLESYELVQKNLVETAFLAKLARGLAVATYAVSQGFSESASEVIIDSDCLSEADQRKLFGLWSRRLQKVLPSNQTNNLTQQTVDIALEAQNGASFTRN